MFEKASPIWLAGREKESHLTVRFKAFCGALPSAAIRVATSGLYHLTVNGQFVAYGPARAGRNHFRMDEIDVSGLLTKEDNVIVIEVCGYYAYSFELMKQPSFLMAEIVSEHAAIAWTGEHFTAQVHPFRRRRTQRYSFQRPMSESYHITGADSFLIDTTVGEEPLTVTEPKTVILRRAPYPQYEVSVAAPLLSGTVTPYEPAEIRGDRAWLNVSEDKLTGYPIEELEVYPTEECQRMAFTPGETCLNGDLRDGTYTVYRFPYNASGMPCLTVTCQMPITLYLLFDEILCDGHVDFLRMQCANILRYDLEAGTHAIQTFGIYTMQYLQVTVLGGDCQIGTVSLIEYKHPPVEMPLFGLSPSERRIAEAAVETFRQNAVDLFMDCPSRERAGWLCDSFFTGRVAHLLTGTTDVETSFLENFLHEEHYDCLPEGMFPMCYPADHRDGVFIPQWAMWLVIELREYRDRGGDPALIEQFRPRVEKLIAYFEGYRNEDGLLENLPGWNFIEWSQANHLIRDVNYPTNMVYAAMLRAAGELYEVPLYTERAAEVRERIREQSFDGSFFVDNAVRRDRHLVPSGERTEVCQYYAFFFGVATPESHPILFDRLMQEFGPDRAKTGAWPEIYPANAFIGNYLRLDMMMRYGYRDVVRQNMEGYFHYMAEQTGTLWENVSTHASCNHGFASYVLCWLEQFQTQ